MATHKRKRVFTMIAILLAAVLLALVIGFGLWFSAFSMGIRPQTLEQARAWQAERYDLSWYDALDVTDYVVTSGDGYALHAQLLPNPVPTDRYMLLSHGYTDNRYGSLKYAKLYLDLGFNVVVYDLRGHGENAPTFCTYSARERRDLMALIEDCRSRWPGMTTLGLHGESLGAATSVAVLEYRPPVDFVVADCGFSNIRDVLAGGLKGAHLPGWLADVASPFARLRFGYGYGDMRPIDSLPGNQIPILFIHGAADTFIPPAHSEAMRDATPGYAELCLIPDAAHAASVLTDPAEYRRAVEAFVGKVLNHA